MLTPAQLQTLKAAIAAETDAAFVADRTVGNTGLMAEFYNQAASPDFWAWRTSVHKREFTSSTSVDGTVFAWTGTGFITRSVGERDAWRELFDAEGFCNPSLANVRQAFTDIFSGATAPAPANRTHLSTVARRKVTRGERLFATGTGSTASPGLLGFEGAVSNEDIVRALEA